MLSQKKNTNILMASLKYKYAQIMMELSQNEFYIQKMYKNTCPRLA